jgi:REP element-mobilizing transposase RayT
MKAAHDSSRLSVFAYCLMPNHFHMILFQRTPGAIPSFIKHVCDGYAKALNKTLHRKGHLFEGTYKMEPINSDEYLLHLSRYIHLNPVRASLVSRAEHWLFSSYRAYITEVEDCLVHNTVVMNACGGAKEYRKFVEEYREEDKRSITALLF